MSLELIPLVLGGAGLIIALLIFVMLSKMPSGSGKVKEIADAIHDGAMVFMKREYTILIGFVIVLAIALYLGFGTWQTPFAFLVGAISSGIAGYFGMFSATKANVRTTVAANEKGSAAALSVAYYGGSIMGLTVASMGLLGLGSLYYMFGNDPAHVHAIHGFGMGASTVALFSRVGGGIFTKSADVGADLVGKIEAGIPEDDPRNPGVIADNVGDNVGDVAGMGSDIFESYCGAMIASIAIASAMTIATVTTLSSSATKSDLMFLPLALASLGLICSILGIFIVKIFSNKAADVALRMGTIGAAILFIMGAYVLMNKMGINTAVWWSVVAGAVGGIIIGLVTEYYTGGKPVRTLAKSGETGPATVMISG